MKKNVDFSQVRASANDVIVFKQHSDDKCSTSDSFKQLSTTSPPAAKV
jgi:hypothetical protein